MYGGNGQFIFARIFLLDDEIEGDVNEAVEDDKEEIRQEPFSLPSGFEWCTLDLQDDSQVCMNHTLHLIFLSFTMFLATLLFQILFQNLLQFLNVRKYFFLEYFILFFTFQDKFFISYVTCGGQFLNNSPF